MNSATLHVNFVSNTAQGVLDTYWIRLELAETDESLSKSEVAEVIDTLYDIDPCNPEEPEPDEEKTDELPFDEEEFAQVIQDKLAPNFCRQADTFYTVQIKVFTSHPEEPYRLQLTNGSIGGKIRETGQITETVTLNGDTSATLSSPTVSKFSVQMPVGMLTSSNATQIAMEQRGSQLSFSEPVHGSMSASYTTEYDLVDINVYNNPDGTPGECLVIAFYHNLTEELSISPPDGLEEEWLDREKYCDPIFNSTQDRPDDNITCYENITYQHKCRCSNSIACEVTEQVVVPCPPRLKHCASPGSMMSDTVEEDDHYRCSQFLGNRTVLGDYVSCPEILYNHQTGEVAQNGENSVMADADYYEARCCIPPTESLPDCQVMWEKNPGGKPIDPKVEAKYKVEWGSRVEFVGISPEDNNCGTIKTVIMDTARSCCDFVTPIVWDNEFSVEILADNSQGVIRVSGGRLPFTVSVRGSGFYLDRSRTMRDAIVHSGDFLIYTGQACGYCVVTVSDGCSTVVGGIRSTNGKWEAISNPGTCLEGSYDTIIDGSVFTTAIISGQYKMVESGSMSAADGLSITSKQCDICRPLCDLQFQPPVNCPNMSVSFGTVCGTRYVAPCDPSLDKCSFRYCDCGVYTLTCSYGGPCVGTRRWYKWVC